MSISTFNYTGRKDVLRTSGENPEIQIKISDSDKGFKFEPIIKIDNEKRGFPKDAKIKIQLYSTSGDQFVSAPFDFGTVANPLKETKEIQVSQEGICFSFRIVDKEKNILCLIDSIKPKKGSTLLRYAERPQAAIFEVEIQPDEIPLVWFKKEYGLKTLLLESNFLKGFIFTTAINQVLTKYLLWPEGFEDCIYRKSWIKHFKSLVGKEPPKKEDFYSGDDYLTEGELWISDAISRFTEKPNKKDIRLIDIFPNEDIEVNQKLQWKK